MNDDRNTEKQKRFFDERVDRHDRILFRARWPRNQLLKARLRGYRDVSVELGRLFTPPGPPTLVPLYDAFDSMFARIPGVRALAIYYVAFGVVPP